MINILKNTMFVGAVALVLTACIPETPLHKVVGPVDNAEITLTDARTQTINFDTMNLFTDKKGMFQFADLSQVHADEFYLISASKGQLQDSDGDGQLDNANVPVQGSLYALVKGSQLKQFGVNVSIFSNIAWEYVRQNYKDFSDKDIARRLNDISKVFFLSDITDDGIIDNQDTLAFEPENPAHLKALAKNYQDLFTKTDDEQSIVDTYILGDTEKMIELLDYTFSGDMSRFPSNDSRSDEVKIEILPFGQGNFSTSDNKIQYTSDGTSKQLSSFYDKNSGKVLVTANTDVDTEILQWSGCDAVSDDKTQCELNTDFSKQVMVVFGYKDAKIVDNLVDVSLAQASLDGDGKVHITVDRKNDELVNKMQNLKAGDYLVGTAGSGFLRKVLSVETISDYKYTFETTQASLDEVIIKGTISFSGNITPNDVPESLFGKNVKPNNDIYNTKNSVNGTALSSTEPKFSTIEGVELIKPTDPNDPKFTVRIGQNSDPMQNYTQGMDKNDFETGIKTGEKSVVLYESEDGLSSVTAKGSMEFTIKDTFGQEFLDGDMTWLYNWTELRSEQTLDVTINGGVDTDDFCEATGKDSNCMKFKIGKITTGTRRLFVSGFPVVVKGSIDIFIGLDGKLSSSLTTNFSSEQYLMSGFVWNEKTGFNGIGMKDATYSFTWQKDRTITGEVTPYFLIDTSLKFYGVAGVSLIKELNVAAVAKHNLNANGVNVDGLICTGGVHVTATANAKAHAQFFLGNKDDDDDDSWHILLGKKLAAFIKRKDEFYDVIKELNMELVHYDNIIYQKHFGGICEKEVAPAKLSLDGGYIYKDIIKGGMVTHEYTVSNVGDEPLQWILIYQDDDGIMSASKRFGVLEHGETETITVTVDSSKISNFGTYKNRLTFRNFSDSAKSQQMGGFEYLSDVITGTTSKSVEVKVYPKPSSIDAPIDLSIQLFQPTQAVLRWSPPQNFIFEDNIEGYNIFFRRKGLDKSWKLSQYIQKPRTNPEYQRAIIENLSPNTTYEIGVSLHASGPIHSKMAVTELYVPSVPSEDDCKAHFSGAYLADRLDAFYLSEINVANSYSDTLGTGYYKDSTQALPKSSAASIDGMSISRGTKVTVYKDKDYSGGIVYTKVGPAVLNNNGKNEINMTTWKIITGKWKPELELEFPPEVREFSNFDMADWSNGSIVIECDH